MGDTRDSPTKDTLIPKNPEEFPLRDIYSVLTDIRADQAKRRQDLQGVKNEMKKK